jgi:hypothetical protein
MEGSQVLVNGSAGLTERNHGKSCALCGSDSSVFGLREEGREEATKGGLKHPNMQTAA